MTKNVNDGGTVDEKNEKNGKMMKKMSTVER